MDPKFLKKFSSSGAKYEPIPDHDDAFHDERNRRPLHIRNMSSADPDPEGGYGRTSLPSRCNTALVLFGSLAIGIVVLLLRMATAPASLFIAPGDAKWLCQRDDDKDGASCEAGDGTPDFEPFLPIVYVILADRGLPVARAIVNNTTPCPRIEFKSDTEEERVPPEVKERAAGDGVLPYAFPVRVCEARIGTDWTDAFFGGKLLPSVSNNPSRYVLFGDTGLRVKPADVGIGNCSSGPALYGVHQCMSNFSRDDVNLSSATGHFQSIDDWHLRSLMNKAAEKQADVTVHLGDYIYRNGPCPYPNEQNAYCSGINLPPRFTFNGTDDVEKVMNFVPGSWGDNWFGWWSDFFYPSLTLLANAPWIALRGNHETCSRAGHGWFLFLSPREYPTDAIGGSFCEEYTDPWRIPFMHEQFLVIDDNNITPMNRGFDGLQFIPGDCPTKAGRDQPKPDVMNRFLAQNPEQECAAIETEIGVFTDHFEQIESMSASHDTNFYLGHRPVFGIACNDTRLLSMDWTMQCSLGCNTLDRVSALFSGHMHWREVITFQDNSLPPQVIIGNGGTDQVPNYIGQGSLNGVNLEIGQDSIISATVDTGETDSSAFGFAILERRAGYDYGITFHGLNVSSGIVERVGQSLSIPKGPRVKGSSKCTKIVGSEACSPPKGHRCHR